jgi:hypothetical protein
VALLAGASGAADPRVAHGSGSGTVKFTAAERLAGHPLKSAST